MTSTITAAANKKQKYLSAVWAPNGYEVVVTTVTNHNFLIDTRKSAVVKSVHAHVEVRLVETIVLPCGTTDSPGGQVQRYCMGLVKYHHVGMCMTLSNVCWGCECYAHMHW